MIHLTESIIAIKVPAESSDFSKHNDTLTYKVEGQREWEIIGKDFELLGVIGAGEEPDFNLLEKLYPKIMDTVRKWLFNKQMEKFGIDLTKEKIVIIQIK